MGIFDVFSAEKRHERKIEGARKKLTNMYYQTQDRMAAAEQAAQLAREGDERGVGLLLIRYEHLAPSTTVDREEKEYVHQLLLGLGDIAIEPVKTYIARATGSVYWPLQFVHAHLGEEGYHTFLCDVLDATPAEYARDPQKKIGIIQLCSDHDSERMNECLRKFVDDHDETVRFHTIDALVKFDRPGTPELLRDHLIDGEEESGRLITRIADTFADKEWVVSERREEFQSKLPAGYGLNSAGVVTRA